MKKIILREKKRKSIWGNGKKTKKIKKQKNKKIRKNMRGMERKCKKKKKKHVGKATVLSPRVLKYC